MKIDRIVKDSLLTAYFLMRVPFIRALKLLPREAVRKTDGISDILIIRLDRMGDFILSLPVIENLKLRYPEAKITVVVKPYLKELAGMIKSIDNIIVYDGYFSTVAKLRKKRYDIAIDMLCDYKLTPVLLAYMSGAPVRIGFAWGGRELLLTQAVIPAEPPDKHMVELGLDLLKTLGVPISVTIPKIATQRASGSARKMVAIHPGGYYKSQRWPEASFAELAKRVIDELKEDVLLLGGPDDRGLIDEIIDGIGQRICKVAFPGAKDLVGLLLECKVLICNNSGPLHLAAALGIPTVSTMGPTDPVLWWPVGDKNIVIRKDVEMKEIRVDDMYDAVKKVIDHSA
jgi:ADP-heptose:LPS heptosyltransferase